MYIVLLLLLACNYSDRF